MCLSEYSDFRKNKHLEYSDFGLMLVLGPTIGAPQAVFGVLRVKNGLVRLSYA